MTEPQKSGADFAAALKIVEGLISAKKNVPLDIEVCVDGFNTSGLIIEARHQKGKFLQFADFNKPGAWDTGDPSHYTHFVSAAFNVDLNLVHEALTMAMQRQGEVDLLELKMLIADEIVGVGNSGSPEYGAIDKAIDHIAANYTITAKD